MGKRLLDVWLDTLEDGVRGLDFVFTIVGSVVMGMFLLLLLIVLTPILAPFALYTRLQRNLNGKQS